MFGKFIYLFAFEDIMKIFIVIFAIVMSILFFGCTVHVPVVVTANNTIANNTINGTTDNNTINGTFPRCVDCAAPPQGCSYSGGSCATCGELVCNGSQVVLKAH